MQTNPLRSFQDPRVDAIYRAVGGRIDLTSIVPTCIEIASEIEQLHGLKGAQKLELLQDVLRLCISESKIGQGEKDIILRTVDSVVPIVVQAAVLASKSPIVKHVQATCMGCF
jgi:hypothetical protein